MNTIYKHVLIANGDPADTAVILKIPTEKVLQASALHAPAACRQFPRTAIPAIPRIEQDLR